MEHIKVGQIKVSHQGITEVRSWQVLKQEPVPSSAGHCHLSGVQNANLPGGWETRTNTAFGSHHQSTVIGWLHFGAYLCLYNIHPSHVQIAFCFIFSFLSLGSLVIFWGRADSALHLYEIAWITMVCFLSGVGIVVQYEDM